MSTSTPPAGTVPPPRIPFGVAAPKQRPPQPSRHDPAKAGGPEPALPRNEETFAAAPLPQESAPLYAPAPEPAMGEAQTVRITASPRQRLLAVFINLLVLSELFVAMYFAAQDPDRLTPIFFKVFFSLLVPTLIVSSIAKRLIRRFEAARSNSKAGAADETTDATPGQKNGGKPL